MSQMQIDVAYFTIALSLFTPLTRCLAFVAADKASAGLLINHWTDGQSAAAASSCLLFPERIL